MTVTFERIQQQIIEFRDEREWGQFHDPKNLAEAIAIESGELLEQFLWRSTEESRFLPDEKLKVVKEEIADIFIFLVYLCRGLDVDLPYEVGAKLEKNRQKYPVEQSKGSSKKYTEL